MPSDVPSRSHVRLALLAAALLLVAFLPTLSATEFSRTLENLNVATALEARRDGHWLQPTLEGIPRTVKPPLLAWITALSMSPRTVADCSSTDPVVRDAAFHALALQARWPALLMASLTVLAVYVLGHAIGDARLGSASALIAAGSFGLLRFAQVAITDVPLTLFVTVAHACFAMAVFRGKRWGGTVGAGAAIGLAFMSKGPAALVQTIVPWVLWAIWLRTPWSAVERSRRAAFPWRPIVAAVVAGLAIAVPWYLAVLLRNPAGQWQVWWGELSGEVAAPDRGEPLPTYLWVVWMLVFPWVLFLGGGLWLAILDLIGRPRQTAGANPQWRQRVALLLITLVATIVILSFRKEKKDRYLLPMIGPVCVIAARCALAYFVERPTSAKRDAVGWIHWCILAVVALGLPIVGLTTLPKTHAGVPAFTPSYALAAAAIAIVLLAVALWTHLRRSRDLTLFATFLVMLFAMVVFTRGYRDTAPGRSDMKPLADALWAAYPDVESFTTQPFGIRAAPDFSVYMNRVTSWTTLEQMATTQPGPRPRVVLVRQRQREPMPAVPAPWFVFKSLPRGDGSTWHAFVLPRTGG